MTNKNTTVVSPEELRKLLPSQMTEEQRVAYCQYTDAKYGTGDVRDFAWMLHELSRFCDAYSLLGEDYGVTEATRARFEIVAKLLSTAEFAVWEDSIS